MKTKSFLLSCFLLGIGLTQLSAQNGKNGNGTNVYEFVVPWEVTLPVMCDGVLTDLITSRAGITIKVRDHFANGILTSEFSSINFVEFTSNLTEEKFTIHGGLEKGYLTAFDPITGWAIAGMVYFHFNVIGNMGSHYIVHMTTDLATGNAEFQSSCH